MYQFRNILFFLISLFTSSTIIAQIDINNLNKKLLEHEIKWRIDSVRATKNLPPLYNDSILYIASNHHANYLVKKGELSHEEKENKTFYTPQDRANYYGAPETYLVGENIAFTPYNAMVKTKTKIFNTTNYEEIARCIVTSWVHSKGHYKNIITPDYQITGLTISVDTVKKRIYACQKFAQVLFKHTFTENKILFPYSTVNKDSILTLLKRENKTISYPFGLITDNNSSCDLCKKYWENYQGLSLKIENNQFILRIEDASFVQNLIQNKNDGFSVELVPFAPFDCGNPLYEIEPSRRNGLKKTSGTLIKPMYRDALLKGFKKRKINKDIQFVNHILHADSISFFKRFGHFKLMKYKAEYFEIKLGNVPKDIYGWWNHNLVYIHNNQICHFVYLTGYKGEVVPEMLKNEYYPPEPKVNYEVKLEYFVDTLKLSYKSGYTQPKENELENLINKFKKQNITIQKINVEGFCSVEGDSIKNHFLHKKRAQLIFEALVSLTSKSTIFNTSSRVDWNHFYKAVQTHPKWKFLYPYSKKEIINYLNKNKDSLPENILNQERKAIVVVYGVKEFNTKTANYYIKRDLTNLFEKSSNNTLVCKNESKLSSLYHYAFYLTQVDTLKVDDFLSLAVPNSSSLDHTLQQDIAYFRYHYLKDSSNENEKNSAKTMVENVFNLCGESDHLSANFHYLSACLLIDNLSKIQKIDKEKQKEIQKCFNRLNLLLDSYELDSSFYHQVAIANLNIIYQLINSIGEEKIVEYNDVINQSLIQLISFYRNSNQLTAEKVVQLAKLLCYFKNISLAVDLCSEFLDNNEVLKIYLPLAYVHSSFLTPMDEKLFEQEYHSLILQAKNRLTTSEWCSLFFDENGIPFQILDNAILRNEFCESCSERAKEIYFKKNETFNFNKNAE